MMKRKSVVLEEMVEKLGYERVSGAWRKGDGRFANLQEVTRDIVRRLKEAETPLHLVGAPIFDCNKPAAEPAYVRFGQGWMNINPPFDVVHVEPPAHPVMRTPHFWDGWARKETPEKEETSMNKDTYAELAIMHMRGVFAKAFMDAQITPQGAFRDALVGSEKYMTARVMGEMAEHLGLRLRIDLTPVTFYQVEEPTEVAKAEEPEEPEPAFVPDPASIERGVYRVHWASGGTSVATVYRDRKGVVMLAPTNWLSPGSYGNWLDNIKHMELLHVE